MRHRVKSIAGPRIVPINCATVDDTGELSASVTELVADGRECQHNVEILAANRHEVRVDLVSAVTLADVPGLRGELIANGYLLIWWEQVRNLTTVQQVIDVFEEGLFDDLRVGEEEHLFLVLEACSPKQHSNVLVELLLPITLRDFDRESLLFIDAATKSCHGSSSRATDTDKHCVTSFLHEHSGNSTQVLNAVTEEHKVHWRVVGIVNFKSLV